MAARWNMKRGERSAALIAMGFAALAPAAYAQEAMPKMGPPGGAGAGPSGIGERSVTFGAHVRATYNSDVPRLAGPGTSGRLREADVLYAPGADADVVLPLGRFYTFLQGSAGYEFYHREPKLNSWRVNTSGGAGAPLGPCKLDTVGNYSRGQTNVEDLTLGVRQNVNTSWSVDGQASCGLIAGIVASVGASYRESNNSAKGATVDNRVRGVNGSLGYGNRLVGTISLFGQYQTTSYSRSAITPGFPLSPEPDIYNIGLQYERPIGRRLVGRASFGYAVIKTNANALPKKETLTGDVGLQYRVTPRLTTQFTYRRNASSTNLEGISYVINDQAGATGTYTLSPRLQASMGATWSKRSYRGAVDPHLVGAPGTEDLFSANGALLMRVGRKSTLSLDGSYQHRDADVSALSFDTFRIGLTAATRF